MTQTAGAPELLFHVTDMSATCGRQRRGGRQLIQPCPVPGPDVSTTANPSGKPWSLLRQKAVQVQPRSCRDRVEADAGLAAWSLAIPEES